MDEQRLMGIYRALLSEFGHRNWWPAETPFEVMVGAVLTQNTAWTNVEKAIANLKGEGLLCSRRLLRAGEQRVARLIRPSGYFNVKATRLKALVEWFCGRANGKVETLRDAPTDALRGELLGLKGVGPETADSILLYALERPVFVVDAYTRRAFSRHGAFPPSVKYDGMRAFFEQRLPRDIALYNEYHALIVELGKTYCRPTPRCEECPVMRSGERPVHIHP